MIKENCHIFTRMDKGTFTALGRDITFSKREKNWYLINIYLRIGVFRLEGRSLIGNVMKNVDLEYLSHGKTSFEEMLLSSSGESTSFYYPSVGRESWREKVDASKTYLTPDLDDVFFFNPNKAIFICLCPILSTRIFDVVHFWFLTCNIKSTLRALTWEVYKKGLFYRQDFTDFQFTHFDLHD